MGRINTIKDQIQEEEMKQEVVRRQISELPKIQSQYETLKTGDLSDVLLDKEKAVILIEKLEKIAENTGNSIVIKVEESVVETKKTSSKNKPVAEATIFDDLPSSDYLRLKITLTGEYDSVVNFIKAIESFEYYCDIVGIQISKNDEESRIYSVNTGTIGSMNPFSPREVDVIKKIQTPNNSLSASLETVFYIKQK
ncbi:MAG: hypothetical protein ACD_9C00184G0001 [uncultured bacterium]|nr:MAG: hypothetical protein ACD_9C00184G0001 [uncultured bacterium]